VAEQALVAIERNDWAEAEELAGRAQVYVQSNGLEDYPLSGLAFVVAARVALHRGDLEAVREHVAAVVRLRPRFSAALAYISAQALVQLAKVYVALSDTGGARAVLRQAHDILDPRPGLGRLPQQ